MGIITNHPLTHSHRQRYNLRSPPTLSLLQMRCKDEPRQNQSASSKAPGVAKMTSKQTEYYIVYESQPFPHATYLQTYALVYSSTSVTHTVQESTGTCPENIRCSAEREYVFVPERISQSVISWFHMINHQLV